MKCNKMKKLFIKKASKAKKHIYTKNKTKTGAYEYLHVAFLGTVISNVASLGFPVPHSGGLYGLESG